MLNSNFIHRNSFWPNGILAESQPPRDEATKMRTRMLCKAKMFGSVPGKLDFTKTVEPTYNNTGMSLYYERQNQSV